MPWSQVYAPLGGPSALVAAIPVVVLLALLAFWHVRAHIAAGVALLAAGLIAVGIYGMPARLAVAAAGYGAAFGLFPIGWIVLNAIFIYELSVDTGQFVVLQQQIAGISRDRRIQALLIAFASAPSSRARPASARRWRSAAAMLIGLGFKPLEAAKLALIGNTAPVAFGSLGIPLVTLAPLTGLDLHQLSAMVGRQLPLFSLIVPFWLVAAQVGWRRMLEVWPACLAAGASFAIMQFVVSNFHGPWLVDIVSAATAMIALVILLRFWQPAEDLVNPAPDVAAAAAAPAAADRPGVEGVAAVAVPLRLRVPLGHDPVKDRLERLVRAADPGARPPPRGAAHAAGGAGADARKGDLQPELPVRHRHAAAARRHRVGAQPRRRRPPGPAHLRPDLAARPRLAADDRGDAGARLPDALRRHRYDDGPRHGEDRLVVPVLLAAPRLARRRAHRQRHLLERALRQPAARHRRAARLLADS